MLHEYDPADTEVGGNGDIEPPVAIQYGWVSAIQLDALCVANGEGEGGGGGRGRGGWGGGGGKGWGGEQWYCNQSCLLEHSHMIHSYYSNGEILKLTDWVYVPSYEL